MNYYEVALGAERHMKSASYTYQSSELIDDNTVVRVPFGKKHKIGVILKTVKKPAFATKDIDKNLNITMDKATIVFAQWYKNYYAAEPGSVYGQLFPSYLTATPKTVSLAGTDKKPPRKIQLSALQQEALRDIESSTKPVVLHGVTGSGKTRVYIELILKTLQSGKSALLLYPEISLTPQIANEIKKFAEPIVFHSQMTNAQKSKMWYTIASASKPLVILGPRSSIFLPYSNLGLIIIDEAHEAAYKQETGIRYNAAHTAAGLANCHGAKLLLGSATPPVSETYQILESGGSMVCLHEKAIQSTYKTSIEIVHSKNRNNFLQHNLLSEPLIEQVRLSLAKHEQILLFMNRRGTAKLVACKDEQCDWQALCEACELPLTFHHDRHELLCHVCSRKATVPNICPKSQHEIVLKTLGNKALVEDVSKIFTEAKIARFDSDNTKEESFASTYEQVRSGEVDILIGTQQLVKGLDLPKLSLVGIIDADLSLHFPDFTSDEKTFQLITQAIGRVGRGHRNGTVIMQTRQPNNPVLKLALKENWHQFYECEIQNRKDHEFPPFVYYAKVIFRNKSYMVAHKKASELQKALQKLGDLTVDGPVDAFYSKKGNFYYVQLHIRSRSRSSLLRNLKVVPDESIVDLDPASLL